MLVLTRGKGEEILIGDNISIVIVDVRGDRVRVGVIAPAEIPVHRREIKDAIQKACGPQYLLRNHTAGYVGNSPLFWKVGGNGYTPWIDEAQRFSEVAAGEIIQRHEGTHEFEAVPLAEITQLAKRTVDAQDMKKAERRDHDQQTD